jgi:predicted esterase
VAGGARTGHSSSTVSDVATIIWAGADPAAARRGAVLVHGRDQDASLMLDVIDRLGLSDVAYVLPVATQRSWYAGRYFDPRATLEPQLGPALAAIETALTTVAGEGIPLDRVVLGGFSQGACLAAELIARAWARRPLAGLAVLTGSLLGTPYERQVTARLDGLPVYASCATDDAWISLADARATAGALAAAGARVLFEELDDTEHHVSDRAVAGLRALLL